MTAMGGLRCIRGMRMTVGAVVGQLAAGSTIDDVLDDYAYLEREDILAALEYAADAVSERDLPAAATHPARCCCQTAHTGDELMVDWELAVRQEPLQRIEPLP